MLMELHINETTNLVTNNLLMNKELQTEQSPISLEKDSKWFLLLKTYYG